MRRNFASWVPATMLLAGCSVLGIGGDTAGQPCTIAVAHGSHPASS